MSEHTESSTKRKQFILFCQAVGLLEGTIYLVQIFRTPISVTANCSNLAYFVDAPGKLLALYLMAVCLPFLISSHRSLDFFGACVVASAAAALLVSTIEAFPSVWCFFAAFLSATLYAHFRIEARPLQTQSFIHQISK